VPNPHSKRPFPRAIRRWCAITFTLAVMAIAGAAQTPAIPAQKPDDAQTVKEFTARVSRYLDERKKQAGSSPRPSNSPEQLDEAQQVVAAKSQDMRVEAKQGDIFSADIAAYFRRQIAATLSGPKGAKIRSSLRSADPVRNLNLRVNQKYPHGVPLQSTPASLLLNLPELPKELQYRIVGRNLVLLDITPKLVVDFVPDAIPAKKD
jgi:hypothetical protein